MNQLKITLILILACAVQEIHNARPKPKPRAPAAPPTCPKDDGYSETGDQHRIANGRFYILHHVDRLKIIPNWDGAFKECKKRGMELAKVDHLTTFWHIINFWRTHIKGIYKDTWYWIAARFNPDTERYHWYKDVGLKPIKNVAQYKEDGVMKYGNYFYRNPRPTGLGTHVHWNFTYFHNLKDYWKDKHGQWFYVQQCLSIAFPWPINDTDTVLHGTYGFNPTLDERACSNKKLRHVICEAPGYCNATDPGPYALSEGKEKYFDEGNFIFGNRLYIVNWGQRDVNASEKYCNDLGLELYNPQLNDTCLIPFLKLWARNVSTSQFWTSWKYEPRNWTFYDFFNNKIHNYSSNFYNLTTPKQPPHNIQFNHDLDIEGRSSAASRYVCMALSHHFEFVSQMKCPDPKSPLCNWHFLTYAPANCNNYQGVICQHKNTTKRTCTWKASWIKKTGGLTDAIKTTALLPFGFETNIQYYRSTYKQTFGSLYCKPGYYMVRDNNTEWHIIPDVLDKNNGDIVFDYDYKETYWVVDKDKFAKPAGSNCTISKVVKGSKYKRYLEKVPCTEWHFYLCKLRFKPAIPIKTTPSDFVEPQYNWNSDWETPRKFSY